MRLASVLLCLALLCSAAGPPPLCPCAPPCPCAPCECSAAEMIRAASVTVANYGSGTLFTTSDGTVWCLSAGHVAVGAKHVQVSHVEQDEDGNETEVSVLAEVIACTTDGDDLALLRLGKGVFPAAGRTRFHTGPALGPDTRILHCGSYRGVAHHSLAHGRVVALGRKLTGGTRLHDQADITVYPGSSGGGVFTSDGRLCGVLTNGDVCRAALYVPIRRVRAWAGRELGAYPLVRAALGCAAPGLKMPGAE